MRIKTEITVGASNLTIDGEAPFSTARAAKNDAAWVMLDATGVNCVRFKDRCPATFSTNMHIAMLAADLNKAARP